MGGNAPTSALCEVVLLCSDHASREMPEAAAPPPALARSDTQRPKSRGVGNVGGGGGPLVVVVVVDRELEDRCGTWLR